MTDFKFLGPYRVEATIGQGGMGTVYRGVHSKTGQRVAVKVLSNQMSREARFRRRFDVEIETLKKLNHPNIVRLIGFGEEQGLLFYSMELVEGPSLLEHLRKVKRLDWDATIGFAIEICAALKHAHDLGIIHRDLKPANLLIEPEGRLKLTDFGIAKLFGSTEQTAVGSVLGTADYMAPEQASGGVITPRTDLYALGSLMYACLVGRPPFGGRHLTQVVHGLKHETPAPLDLVLPEVPPELSELVHELLSKSPDDRPPTALAVGKRLGALRAGLRRRSEKTQSDLSGPTLSESPPSPPVPPFPAHAAASRPFLGNRPTAAESDSDVQTGAGADLAPTLASQAAPVARRPTARSAGGSHETSVAEPLPAPRTHFETVPPDRVAPEDWSGTPGFTQDPRQWISVLGLVVMLLATGGIIAWMLRSPSPAELISRVEQAEASGDSRSFESAAEDFLRAYPEDPRSDALRDALAVGDVEQMARRLRARAALIGGVENLDPAEQTWLEAVELRSRQPRAAAQQLEQWLAVFDHRETATGDLASDPLSRLVPLARLEAERLHSEPAIPDERAERLKARIHWGLENLQGPRRQEFVESVRALFGDKAWAAEALRALPPQKTTTSGSP